MNVKRALKIAGGIALVVFVLWVMLMVFFTKLANEKQEERSKEDREVYLIQLQFRAECRVAVEAYLGPSIKVYDWDGPYTSVDRQIFNLDNGFRVHVIADTGQSLRRFKCYLGNDGEVEKVFED